MVRLLFNILVVFIIQFCINSTLVHSQPNKYIPLRDTTLLVGQPYERYSTKDQFGRNIIFYLSEVETINESLPLIVYIHGSGCNSLFVIEGKRVIPISGHITLNEVSKNKARILIVEKPGVNFLANPKEGCRSNEDFNNEHTFERWVEAVQAAILATHKISNINTKRMMVIGHSEGGLVAARIARNLPNIVTHVASLAGGGITQLYDILSLARKGHYFSHISEDPEERVNYVINEWKKIQHDPMSTDKFFLGYSYRRWSTFLASSPIEELSKVRAKIYIAHGVNDSAVDVTSSDALFAHLLAQGKNVVYERIENADHSFKLLNNQEINGWQNLLTNIIDWYLV